MSEPMDLERSTDGIKCGLDECSSKRCRDSKYCGLHRCFTADCDGFLTTLEVLRNPSGILCLECRKKRYDRTMHSDH